MTRVGDVVDQDSRIFHGPLAQFSSRIRDQLVEVGVIEAHLILELDAFLYLFERVSG